MLRLVRSPLEISWMNFLILGAGMGAVIFSSCSSAPRTTPYLESIEVSSQVMKTSSQWRKKFDGNISDMDIARETRDILVTEVARPGETAKPKLHWLNAKGDFLFSLELTSAVKDLAIDPRGVFGVVRDFEGKWTVYGKDGKSLWSRYAPCKPTVLPASDLILCFHDDDPFPKVLVEAFNYGGEKKYEIASSRDVTAFRVAESGKYFAVAEVGGKVSIYNPAGVLQKEWNARGEVLDMDFSAEEIPSLALLSLSKKEGQILQVASLGSDKNLVNLPFVSIPIHCEQVRLIPSGKIAILYGNGPKGQFLIQFTTYDLGMNWQRLNPFYADYTLPIKVDEDWILMSYEGSSKEGRIASMAFMDLEGKRRAIVPIRSEPSAYIYQTAPAAHSTDTTFYLAVSTDDQSVELFQVEK